MQNVLLAEPEPVTRGFLERHLRQDGFEVLEYQRSSTRRWVSAVSIRVTRSEYEVCRVGPRAQLVTSPREIFLRSSGAMEIDPSELARVLRRVALAVEENTRLLSKINDLHREATELHGELGEALTDLEELLKRVEVE